MKGAQIAFSGSNDVLHSLFKRTHFYPCYTSKTNVSSESPFFFPCEKYLFQVNKREDCDLKLSKIRSGHPSR